MQIKLSELMTWGFLTEPITLAHVIEAIGIDYTELEEYVPLSKSRGSVIAALEDKLTYFIKQYLDKNIYQTKEEVIDRIKLLNQADPTENKASYTSWIIKQDINKSSQFPEDLEKIKEVLVKFDKIKSIPGIELNKDINTYKTYSDLVKALEPYEETKSKTETEKELVTKGSEVVYQDSTYQVLKISTPEASHDICYNLGAEHWCVKDIKFAKDYLKTGPLFLIIKDKKPYVLAHRESQSLMDFYDKPVPKSVFEELQPILTGLDLVFFKYDLTAIMRVKEWKGYLDLSNTEITSLPEGLSVSGDLDLSNTEITSLPEGLSVSGDLNLSNTKITSLPKGLSIGGNLNLSNTKITSLPEGLSVGSGLYLSNTEITSLPEGLSVGSGLYLSNTEITSLPEGLSVSGDLNLSNTKITSLPEGLSVSGYLDLRNTKITSLPEGLSVGSGLYLRNTKITSLPKGLSIGGNLDLSNTEITSLPEDLKVKGKIYGFEKKRKSYSTKDIPKSDSITVAHLVEGIGIDYLELEDEPTQEYVPVSRERGKSKLYEVVNTLFGRGRIVTRQTESKPYSYGVRITGTDEVELVEERQMKRIRKSVIVNPQQTQQSYSLDSILGCDEDEEKKPIGLKDVIKKHEKDSIFKLGASTDWLHELWKREADKVMRELADKSPEFAEEYSTKHIPLYEEYIIHDLKRVTVPYMEGSIDKDQAEKLLRDLMYQFREKLYIDHGLSHAEVVKDKEKDEMQMDLEKESYTERDLPAFGSANQYPYSGTGAGMPSSGDLSRIINDVPSRNVIIK